MTKLTEKLILKCIKNEEESLKRNMYNLMRVDHKPDKIILVFNGNPPQDKPELECDGVKIPVEMIESVPKTIISVENEEGVLVPETEESRNVDDEFYKEFSEKANKFYNIKEAIGPHSVPKDEKSEAFQEWKKRYNKTMGKND